MVISDRKIKEITRKIMVSRMRILVNNGFYGLLLMHIKISLSNEHETAWTDCRERIYFNPAFVDRLSDRELDYVLMHQVIHAALRHGDRRGDFVEDIFDMAADIVVNSNILLSNSNNEAAITLRSFGGVQPHQAPDGREGYEYSVEELYHVLLSQNGLAHITGEKRPDEFLKPLRWDIHITDEGSDEEKESWRQQWELNIRKACNAISIRDSQKQRGIIPMFAQRFIDGLRKAKTDWRQLLNEFVQDEVNDYSFMPPDRRMADSPFFLPDYNEKDYKPGKILFMIDTSGSMSDSEITACYSEIKGAIEQFNGKLEGLLGFFDAAVVEPVPFENEEELLIIKPVGGGGTSFHVVFDYVRDKMMDNPPQSIVILTDGYAPWPNEELAMDIPVLWIVNNEDVTPPWGVVARLKIIL